MNFKEINILKTICEPLFDYFDYTIKPFDLNYLTIPVGVLISHCVGQLACQSACLVHCLYNFCAIIKGKGLDALLCREITHDCTLLHLNSMWGFTIACIVSQNKYLMSNTRYASKLFLNTVYRDRIVGTGHLSGPRSPTACISWVITGPALLR